MILHRLGLINKNQRGLTFLEFVLALAITAIIMGGITMVIFQVFTGSANSSNHMAAIRQVQNAGYWISWDAQMAQSVEPGVASGFPLTLSWTETEWEEGKEHQVVYSLEDMPGNGLKSLLRSHSVDGGEPTETIVAEYIDPALTNCEFTGGELALTVTATAGGWQPVSETRVYEVIPRPST